MQEEEDSTYAAARACWGQLQVLGVFAGVTWVGCAGAAAGAMTHTQSANKQQATARQLEQAYYKHHHTPALVGSESAAA